MQHLLWALGIVLASYLIGSISTAILVSKIFRLSDPRTVGSHNPGATNMLRIGGKLPAVLTLLGDALKGFVPVFLTKLYFPMLGAPANMTSWVISAVFLAVILGHLYPIFFKFKGGKGVATAIGGLFGLHWILGLSFIFAWLVTAYLTGYSALSALVASALMPIVSIKMHSDYTVAILIVVILIFWRHRTNIKNLLNGTEPVIGKK